MRSGNPILNSDVFQQPTGWNPRAIPNPIAVGESRANAMTIQGTAVKTLILLSITIVSAALSWNFFLTNPGAILFASIGSIVGSLVAGFIVMAVPKAAPWAMPLFAVGEGGFVAAISIAVIEYTPLAEHAGPETVFQAAAITMAIAMAMLLAYVLGLVRLRGVAAKVVIVMIAGVSLYYVGTFLVNLVFGAGTIPQLGWSSSPLGILFSAVVVVLASISLVLDFQFIEDGAAEGKPKYVEWIGAFGLLTSLVWLYIEVLRLLAKLNNR